MKFKSEFVWAFLLFGTAIIFFFVGAKRGGFNTEDELERQIRQKDEKIQVLEDKIQQLSQELTSRGIYSYPQASLVSEIADSSATVFISLNGNEPLKNLEIRRNLIYGYSGASEEDLEELTTGGKSTFIDALKNHNPAAFEIPALQKEVALYLLYRTGRSEWHQYVWAVKTTNGNIKSFWIITNKAHEVIDKHIDEGFPVDGDGRVIIGKEKRLRYPEIKMNSVFEL